MDFDFAYVLYLRFALYNSSQDFCTNCALLLCTTTNYCCRTFTLFYWYEPSHDYYQLLSIVDCRTLPTTIQTPNTKHQTPLSTIAYVLIDAFKELNLNTNNSAITSFFSSLLLFFSTGHHLLSRPSHLAGRRAPSLPPPHFSPSSTAFKKNMSNFKRFLST